jgi:lipopolysaccharide export system permease protein
MKKIDRLIIMSFIPPMVVWFLVAAFIFNMQFLWKYIDEIVGKDLEITIILELLFYQGLAMVPRALVFGVVIASVMTLGNLAEHYELVSMKSAGISLMRVLSPLLLIVSFLAIASFIFSNHIIPYTALQFKTRLYDIRRQKPALDLEPGLFNKDFRSIVIYIGDKDKKSQQLKDIRIYDHSKQMGNNTQTNAKSGDLYVTDDKKYLVIELQNGQRYENMQLNVKNSPNQLPYMRTSFTEYRTVFDLSEFNFSETDKELFKNHHSLLTMNQLLVGVDSILIRRDKRIVEMQQSCDNFFHFRRAGLIVQSPSDSVKKMQYHPYSESEPKEISELQNFVDIFQKGERHSIYQRAQGLARNIKIQAENMSNSLPRFKEEVAAYENEIHLKLVFSVACILFLFIGAPMGAIIRKGGFGWPIFISFVFFMVFFVLHLTGERLATGLVWPTWMGSWLPIWALFPVAVFLTFKAMNDSRVLSLEFFTGFFVSLFRKKVK